MFRMNMHLVLLADGRQEGRERGPVSVGGGEADGRLV